MRGRHVLAALCGAVLFVGLALCGCRAGPAPADGAGAGIPAFPGAEGFGSRTPGGRGGRVISVTNLDDSGPGSLRAACEAEGPRVVVFRVSGLITLSTPIVIRNPFMTVAAQTAPGAGVCLRGSAFVIATHDVIVRYLRSRLGDLSGRAEDSITVERGSRDVILDHCSASWGIDETLSLAGDLSYVTVQWCLIAEGLSNSKHPEGEHSFGSLVRASGPVSLHHNLWAHNKSRNPRLGDTSGEPPYPSFDLRNNVVYDFGDVCSGMTQGVFEENYVANYLKPGPSSTATHAIRIAAPSDISLYVRDNVFEGDNEQTADNLKLIQSIFLGDRRQVRILTEPFASSPVRTQSAAEAYESVLASAGATLPSRDAADARVIEEVRARAGRVIDSQEQVGGWPEYPSASPPSVTEADLRRGARVDERRAHGLASPSGAHRQGRFAHDRLRGRCGKGRTTGGLRAPAVRREGAL